MKYKNKDGIELNFTGDDSVAGLVKEVISEAIRMLGTPRPYPHRTCNEVAEFLKENFDIVSIEDYIKEKEDV
tara:strand:- start:109 stop:324 length:216 start_codon:yes stop_codon:yes gene_type:complete